MKRIGHKGRDDEANDTGGGKGIRETQPGDAQGGVSGTNGKTDAVVGILRAD